MEGGLFLKWPGYGGVVLCYCTHRYVHIDVSLFFPLPAQRLTKIIINDFLARRSSGGFRGFCGFLLAAGVQGGHHFGYIGAFGAGLLEGAVVGFDRAGIGIATADSPLHMFHRPALVQEVADLLLKFRPDLGFSGGLFHNAKQQYRFKSLHSISKDCCRF